MAPSSTTDRRLRHLYLGVLFTAIALDGAAHPLGAGLATIAFAVVLLSTSVFSTGRGLGGPLPIVSITVAFAVVATALVQVRWDPAGRWVHSVWTTHAGAIGEVGGTLSVNRLQPIWEIPGAVLPFLAAAAAVPLFRSSRGAEKFWRAAAIGGAVFAAYGLAQWMLFPTWHFGSRDAYRDSLSGFYVNRNAAAALLLMTAGATLLVLERLTRHVDIGLLIASFVRGERLGPHRRDVAIYAALFALQLLALLTTKSRAGIVLGTTTLAVAVALHQYGRLPAGSPGRRRLHVALGLGAAALLVWTVGGQVGRRLEIQGIDDARWCFFPQVLTLVADNWPFGVGLGGFQTAFPAYRTGDCGLPGLMEKAHDTYLQGLATMGVVFPVLALALAAAALPALVRRMRGHRPEAAVMVALIGIDLALHSLVDFPLEIPGNAALYATFFAAALATASSRSKAGGGRAGPPRRRGEVTPSGPANRSVGSSRR